MFNLTENSIEKFKIAAKILEDAKAEFLEEEPLKKIEIDNLLNDVKLEKASVAKRSKALIS